MSPPRNYRLRINLFVCAVCRFAVGGHMGLPYSYAFFPSSAHRLSQYEWVGETMGNRFSNLKCKEVVNVCDGCRLGFVTDVEVDICSGRIVAIVVPCKCKGFSFFSHRDDFVIPWQCIRRIGDDIILVDGDLEKFRLLRPKREFF